MIGVLGAIAAPSWQGFLDRRRMVAARGELMSVLKNAQDEAQSRQQSKEVRFPDIASLAPGSSPLAVEVRNVPSSAPGLVTVLGSEDVSDKFHLIASSPIVFDHDGRVDVPTPYVMRIVNSETPSASQAQSCVIVTTLLGSLKAANNDLCDSF
ncbi:MAG: hypothetical protein AAFY72_00545 [Cyanobacteria bacterium J06649_4]